MKYEKKLEKANRMKYRWKLFKSRSMIEEKNIYFRHDGIKKIQVKYKERRMNRWKKLEKANRMKSNTNYLKVDDWAKKYLWWNKKNPSK